MVNSIVPPRFNSRFGKNGKSRLLPFSLTDWTWIFLSEIFSTVIVIFFPFERWTTALGIGGAPMT